MSSDNYYLVRPNPRGGFSAVMQFASDEVFRPATSRHESFPTPEEALESVKGEYVEYNNTISDECRPTKQENRSTVKGGTSVN